MHLSESGPVRIARLRVLCPDAGAERATIEVRVALDAKAAGQVTIATTLVRAPAVGAHPEPNPRRPTPAASRVTEHPLAAGSNQVRWRMVGRATGAVVAPRPGRPAAL